MNWHNSSSIPSREYTCGYWGNVVASAVGFHSTSTGFHIYICPHLQETELLRGRQTSTRRSTGGRGQSSSSRYQGFVSGSAQLCVGGFQYRGGAYLPQVVDEYCCGSESRGK